jgi:HEPN domain-containing protein
VENFMTARKVTRTVISLVENKRGCPVVVNEKTSLSRKIYPKCHPGKGLIEKMKLKLPEDLQDFTSTLNRVSVPTRYPDDLRRILKDYDKKKTREVWIKAKRCCNG